MDFGAAVAMRVSKEVSSHTSERSISVGTSLEGAVVRVAAGAKIVEDEPIIIDTSQMDRGRVASDDLS
jgi:hypothetical protein